MGLFGIEDLRDTKQAYARGVLNAKAGYTRFESGEGWSVIARDFGTSPYYMEKACKHYAARVGLNWPARVIRETRPLKCPKPLSAAKVRNKLYMAKVEIVNDRARYVYERYANGFTTAALGKEYKIRTYYIVKILREYAKRHSLQFPMTKEQRAEYRKICNDRLKKAI